MRFLMLAGRRDNDNRHDRRQCVARGEHEVLTETIGQPTCDKGESGIEKAAPVTTNQTYRVVVRSTDPKTGYSQTRAVSGIGEHPRGR